MEENSGAIWESFMYALVAGKDLKSTDIFNEESYRELDRKLRKSRRSGNPPLCTHELAYRNDVILNALNASGLANTKDDRVKVVFYPCYLSEGDHLLNLSMQEAIQGCHLGVFPSYYEPWGYTPIETAAESVPAITSDSSGLGRFLLKLGRDSRHPGIFVINNFGKNEAEVVKQLEEILHNFILLPKEERVEDKINARELVDYFDWEVLVENYIEAHNKAVETAAKNNS